jgi:hypothetical protein
LFPSSFSSDLFRSVIGDLFDMLLPMLSIYQEYVRNHHYSLQVLTECKSNPNFATVLKRLEGECKNFITLLNFLKSPSKTKTIKLISFCHPFKPIFHSKKV